MKYSRFVIVLLLACLALYLVACSAKPTDQIARTEKAREQAQTEHAQVFAAEDWGAAEQAWTEAQAKIAAEKWGDSNLLLLRAQKRFEKARDLAKGKREDTIREIQGLQKTVGLRCKALKDAINASGKKLNAARKKELEDACQGTEEKMAKVAKQLEGGQYNDAKFLAQTTLREVWESQKQLESYTGSKLGF
jgi:hypothetical protein